MFNITETIINKSLLWKSDTEEGQGGFKKRCGPGQEQSSGES